MSQGLPIRRRIPWGDLFLEIAVGAGFLVAPIVVGVLGDVEPLLIVLATGAMASMGIIFIANYESLRSPFRDQVLKGKALIDAVDVWLRDDGWTRGFVPMEGYSHALEIAGQGDFKMWIGVEAGRNILVFMGARRDHEDSFANLGNQAEAVLVTEAATEAARLGVFYRIADGLPFTITFWDVLPVDRDLTRAKVLEKVIFINRADALVVLVARKHLLAAPTLPSVPPVVTNWRQPEPT